MFSESSWAGVIENGREPTPTMWQVDSSLAWLGWLILVFITDRGDRAGEQAEESLSFWSSQVYDGRSKHTNLVYQKVLRKMDGFSDRVYWIVRLAIDSWGWRYFEFIVFVKWFENKRISYHLLTKHYFIFQRLCEILYYF